MTASALLPVRSWVSSKLSGTAGHRAPTLWPIRASLFRRIVEAVADSNRRKAEREIAAFVARNGGKLSDSLERHIERSFL